MKNHPRLLIRALSLAAICASACSAQAARFSDYGACESQARALPSSNDYWAPRKPSKGEAPLAPQYAKLVACTLSQGVTPEEQPDARKLAATMEALSHWRSQALAEGDHAAAALAKKKAREVMIGSFSTMRTEQARVEMEAARVPKDKGSGYLSLSTPRGSGDEQRAKELFNSAWLDALCSYWLIHHGLTAQEIAKSDAKELSALARDRSSDALSWGIYGNFPTDIRDRLDKAEAGEKGVH